VGQPTRVLLFFTFPLAALATTRHNIMT
jgi:hypothetical protein